MFVEIKASKLSLRRRSPIYGIGINDAKYTTKTSAGYCPYYAAWKRILRRCYSEEFHARQPSYSDCTICNEWVVFSNFRRWMEGQDWKGKSLDKDILDPGNKVYGPEKCIFVSSKINSMLIDRSADRGDYPIGASFSKRSNKFTAQCGANGGRNHLGFFDTAEEASSAYKLFKSNHIREVANKQDPVLRAALLRHADLMLDPIT